MKTSMVLALVLVASAARAEDSVQQATQALKKACDERVVSNAQAIKDAQIPSLVSILKEEILPTISIEDMAKLTEAYQNYKMTSDKLEGIKASNAAELKVIDKSIEEARAKNSLASYEKAEAGRKEAVARQSVLVKAVQEQLNTTFGWYLTAYNRAFTQLEKRDGDTLVSSLESSFAVIADGLVDKDQSVYHREEKDDLVLLGRTLSEKYGVEMTFFNKDQKQAVIRFGLYKKLGDSNVEIGIQHSPGSQTFEVVSYKLENGKYNAASIKHLAYEQLGEDCRGFATEPEKEEKIQSLALD